MSIHSCSVAIICKLSVNSVKFYNLFCNLFCLVSLLGHKLVSMAIVQIVIDVSKKSRDQYLLIWP